VFGVNVRVTLLTVQHAVPLMTAGGSVILNGTAGTVKGLPGATVYHASKAALRSFARTWTAELIGRGIRVNLLSPGPIETPVADGIPAEVLADEVARLTGLADESEAELGQHAPELPLLSQSAR
jgi:NAD(P)-dependent dehydrogenase (short-subunit alcohol dehydrogenase family)